MEPSSLEHRLASLESTLLPAEAAVQPLLKSVQVMVQRLNEIQDRSMAEFFEKYALIEPLISGESNGADGDSDWSRRRLDARAADALIAEAAPDLEATAQQFEAFAAAVPVLDHPDAKRLFHAANAPSLSNVELSAAQLAHDAASLHARLLALVDINFVAVEEASRQHILLDAQLRSYEDAVALRLQPRNS